MAHKTDPIKVFIHVPKTAGSTINDYLERSGFLGGTHVEAWIEDGAVVTEKLLELDWVSGHVPLPAMHARLSVNSSRPLQYFTLLRDPIEQIMSHYNWLIEIHCRGSDFYDGHPTKIKEISESIRKTDNSNPSCVIEQLESAAGLFLNQQSRIALGHLPTDFTENDISKRLELYSMVATEGCLSQFIHQISGMTYNRKVRKNVSKYHFDKSIFECEQLQDFLKEKHAADIAVYRYIQDRYDQSYQLDKIPVLKKIWLKRLWGFF